jgi:hypothetical protein
MLSSAIGSKILTVHDASHRGGYGTIDTVAATVHYYADYPVARPSQRHSRQPHNTANTCTVFRPDVCAESTNT